MKTVLLEHYILFERKPKETVVSAVVWSLSCIWELDQ